MERIMCAASCGFVFDVNTVKGVMNRIASDSREEFKTANSLLCEDSVLELRSRSGASVTRLITLAECS